MELLIADFQGNSGNSSFVDSVHKIQLQIHLQELRHLNYSLLEKLKATQTLGSF